MDPAWSELEPQMNCSTPKRWNMDIYSSSDESCFHLKNGGYIIFQLKIGGYCNLLQTRSRSRGSRGHHFYPGILRRLALLLHLLGLYRRGDGDLGESCW